MKNNHVRAKPRANFPCQKGPTRSIMFPFSTIVFDKEKNKPAMELSVH